MVFLPFALLLPDMFLKFRQRIFYPTPVDKLMIRIKRNQEQIAIAPLKDERTGQDPINFENNREGG